MSTVGQQTPPQAVPLVPVDAILDAFKTHQVVTLPGGHAGNELHALLLKVIRDPRFPALVNDVVIEEVQPTRRRGRSSA